MKLLCAGGGSGGHVTPVAAVINELAKSHATLDVLFVSDKSFEHQARRIMSEQSKIDVKITTILAGKYRRYSHLSHWQHLTTPQIVLRNLVDVGKIVIGYFQSLSLLWRYEPDAVFAKGGFVCLPVGMAARTLRIPIIVHDSDARPGLTNRVLSRWATAIATGSPLENYNYPRTKSRYVGVPISKNYRPYSDKEKKRAKEALGYEGTTPLVVEVGGSLGAGTINTALMAAGRALIRRGIGVYHVAGKQHAEEVAALAPSHELYQVTPFVYRAMDEVLGAADVVISRAGATALQEFAGMALCCIVVPSRALGDQKKNARIFAEAGAVIALTDDEIAEEGRLAREIIRLIDNPKKRRQLSETLHDFARPHAARDVASMIADVIQQRSTTE